LAPKIACMDLPQRPPSTKYGCIYVYDVICCQYD
jgi:hypothetical protein